MAFRNANKKVMALVGAASGEVRALFNKQEVFTFDESNFLKEWLQAVLEGRLDLAERLVDHGIRVEHFRSVLEPGESREDALAIVEALKEENDAQRKEFLDRNKRVDEPIDPDRDARGGYADPVLDVGAVERGGR